MAHAGGRPTDYDIVETIRKAEEYLASCVDEEYQLIKTEGDKSTTWENKLRVKLPTIEGLANYLDTSRDTLYEWEKEKPEFSDILRKLRQEQADRLMNRGISGDYNSTIAKVLLTKHGYREGTDVTTDGKELPSPILKNVSSNNSNIKDNVLDEES